MACENCGGDVAGSGLCASCGHASGRATPSQGCVPVTIGIVAGLVAYAALLLLPAFLVGYFTASAYGHRLSEYAVQETTWIVETVVVLAASLLVWRNGRALSPALRSGLLAGAVVLLGGLSVCDVFALPDVIRLMRGS
jgi:hypothetical protein